jgi:hypothetical protein
VASPMPWADPVMNTDFPANSFSDISIDEVLDCGILGSSEAFRLLAGLR